MRLRDRRLALLTGSAACALLAPFPSAQQPFGPAPTPADLVAELQLEAPTASRFVLRGNVPVPRGTHFPGGAQFAQVIDQDGTWLADTQIDIVTRNAGTGGIGGSASVVQFSALVNRDPAIPPGTLLNYQLVPVAGAVPAGPGTPDVMDLANGPRDVPAPIQALVLDPQSVVIRAETITSTGASKFYYAYPLQGTADLRIERFGPAMTTLRSFRVMEPDSLPVPNAYPHLFGVHAYFTTWAEQPYTTVEFCFSNGGEGSDLSSPLDDQNGGIHYKRVDLLLASDANAWTPAVDFLDPYSAQPGHVPGTATLGTRTYRTFPIVKPIRVTTGLPSLHWTPCKGRFVRRMGIASSSTADQLALRQALDQEGQGFCVKGVNGLGVPYWSWFNPATPNYFPQRHQLPTLDFPYTTNSCPGLSGLDALRCQMTQRLGLLVSALENGTPFSGPFVGSTTSHGPHRPIDLPDPAAVGGTGVVVLEGDEVAATCSRVGLLEMLVQHRMTNDRQATCIYDLHGEPTKVERWLTTNPATSCWPPPPSPGTLGPNGVSWMYFGYSQGAPTSQAFPCQPWGGGSFGWDQEQGVGVHWQLPDYETNPDPYRNLGSFLAHLPSHLTRFTRYPMALAWLINDPLAKDDLHMQAELARMEFSEYPALCAQNTAALYYDMHHTLANPGRGTSLGRAFGWGMNVVNASYALARRDNNDQRRVDYRRWYDDVVDTVERAQTTTQTVGYPAAGTPYTWGKIEVRGGDDCYGCALWCGNPGACPPGTCGTVPCPSPQQTWEEMIILNGLRGMQKSVYAATEAQSGRLSAVLDKAYYGLVSTVNWNPLLNTIHGKVAVLGFNGLPVDAPVGGVGSNPHPPAPHSPHGTEAYHYMLATIGDAYESTLDPLFLDSLMLFLTGNTCGAGCIPALEAALESTSLPASLPGWSPVADSFRDSWPQRGRALALMQQ